MTDDARAEIAALEREMVAAHLKAMGKNPTPWNIDAARQVIRAAETVRAKHLASVPREMTGPMAEPLWNLERMAADTGRILRHDATESAYAEMLAAGEVWLFGEGG